MNKTFKRGMLAVGVAAGSAFCGSAFMAPSTFAIGNQAFHDANFYECVVKQYAALNPDKNITATSDTELTDAQLASIKTLNCNYGSSEGGYTDLPSYYTATAKITDTAGLSKLIGLETLYLSGHNYSTIDVTKNTQLKQLSLYSDSLTTLSLSGLAALRNLNLGGNSLATLDLSQQKDLVWLQVSYNNLTTLDLSNNTKLESLQANHNKLTTLTLGENTKLKGLEIVDNKLTQIDVSKSPDLETLFADNIIVKPYTKYDTTDACELTASLKFVGVYNTIVKTSSYSFDDETHLLTMKSRPAGNAVDTIEVKRKFDEISANYRIYFGDQLKTEFDKLDKCEVKVPDTDAGVKTPDTGGSLTEEFDGKLIGASVLGVATVALLGFAGAYAFNRRKNHIKF